MNDFRQITVCAVDCLNPHLAARALERSMDQCDFADAILLTDTPVPTRARVVPCGPIRSRRDYSHFVLQQMAEHIRTPYVLIVQWDGFVLDARQWDSGFLAWDYIGAPWPSPQGPTVGNGGFSLRSRRLLDALADPVFKLGEAEVEVEDQFICTQHRKQLEQDFGVRFAPSALAERFSHEIFPPPGPVFGFHGLNFMSRHFGESQMLALTQDFVLPTFSGLSYIHLILGYMQEGNYGWAQRFLQVALSRMGEEEGFLAFRRTFKDPAAGEAFVATCRQLMALRLPTG